MADKREEVTQEQIQVIKAVLGIDAETFRRTNVGKYIFDAIEAQELILVEELIQADPGDVKANTDIRNQISLRRALPLFIDEAMAAGRVAEENMRKMEDHKDY